MNDRPATVAEWMLLFTVFAIMIRETDRRLSLLEAQMTSVLPTTGSKASS